MKRLLAGLFVATVINMPDDAMIAIIPISCGVDTSTGAVFIVNSTGPVKMKSDTSPDCYSIKNMNANGTCGPTTWTPCK